MTPVNDSATLQGAEFTCAVGTGGEEAVQSFTVSIIGMLEYDYSVHAS